ncbi:DUF808 domain-containing protein [Sphingomicrobium nitratireducens]|uniref:DUF808 domain-containing protein n=1 Tax=Sphingomicrobium nitratireducens TaxID=2964666 RepID=UPI00223FBD87|nr:DUF808 domain-containing protein [Sphingomicrobium nitratireducens]
MPSGLTALLDDVAAIARLASASVDDVAAAAGRAGTKTAGVVIDDAAVTPKYMMGLSPARELPIIGKITLGSLRNKLVFLLPIALLLSRFAPWAITPILMMGGTYLAFEAVEKILEAISHDPHAEETLMEADTPEELEARQVKGAIRTDFILSAEIMAIALSQIPDYVWWQQGLALALVAVAVTVGVYGTVAIIVKLDDIGLHLAREHDGLIARFGEGLVRFVPKLLKSLSVIGTAAMLWVGGGILVHGLEDLHFLTVIPERLHHVAHAWSGGQGWLEWLINALGASAVGAIVGFVAVRIHHRIMGPYHAPGGGE